MATITGNTRRSSSTMWKSAGYTARRWRSPVLIVGGLGFLTAAAYTWDTIAGLVATGVSLLLVEMKPREDRR